MDGSVGVIVDTDRSGALEILERRCASDPGGVVGRLLARLRRHPDEVVRALAGVPLRVRVALTEPCRVDGWIVFTQAGNVASVSDDVMNRERASPDLLLQGPSHLVLAALLGLVHEARALDSGVLIPMAPMDRLVPLLGLLRRELIELAEDYNDA